MNSASIQSLFDSGHAADVVLLALAIEGLWLMRRGWSVRRVAQSLGAAALVVLAARAALVGAAWYWVALPLLASFPLHLLDLKDRFERDETRK